LSIIPYYLSDGQTNNFRANMLFPFICINDPQNLNSGCAVNDIGTKGFVYKYYVIQNLDLNRIKDWINSEIIKTYGQRGHDFINIKLKESSENNTIGVSSVLPRIENLLDFLLAISSERIINKYPIEEYRPNIRHPPNSFDFKFNTRGMKENKEDIDIYDFYRDRLLFFFNEYYNKFMKDYKFINILTNKFPLHPITLNDFNNIYVVKICNSETKQINPLHRQNTDNYINISNKLLEIIKPMITFHENYDFWKKFNDVPLEETHVFIEKYKYFFGIFNSLIKEPVIIKNPSLDNNIIGWNAKCKKKYLKYKLKYLSLKKKLLI
jgi:hypothetical protein